MTQRLKITVFLLIAAAAWSNSALADESPDRICFTPLLTAQEQDQCRREINGAKDGAQLRQAQQKYQDAIKRVREIDAKRASQQPK